MAPRRRASRFSGTEYAFVQHFLERAGFVAGQVETDRRSRIAERRGDEQRFTGGGEGQDFGLEAVRIIGALGDGLRREGCTGRIGRISERNRAIRVGGFVAALVGDVFGLVGEEQVNEPGDGHA